MEHRRYLKMPIDLKQMQKNLKEWKVGNTLSNVDQELSWWNLYQTPKCIQNQGIKRQGRRLPKRIYLRSGAWGIALIFSEIETPTMKLPIIYHTWSLKGETEKHLVLLLFKHMIAEHSHPGCGFERWCVWKGPASKPLQPNARLLSVDSPISRAKHSGAWAAGCGANSGMLSPSRSPQIFPNPS